MSILASPEQSFSPFAEQLSGHPLERIRATLPRIAEVTFTVHSPDGVALQCQENVKQLRANGYFVLEVGADVPELDLPEFDYQSAEALALKQALVTKMSEEEQQLLIVEIRKKAARIREKLKNLILNQGINVAHIRNISSLPYLNLPVSLAVAELITELPQVLFVLHHHDFTWEGPMAQFFQTANQSIAAEIRRALVPTGSNVRHIVINTLAQQELALRLGVQATCFPDGYDFDRQPLPLDVAEFRRQMGLSMNDLLLGAMVRIRPNKSLELSIEFVKMLMQQRHALENHSHGITSQHRLFDQNSKIVLFFVQDKDMDKNYLQQLLAYAECEGVDLRFIGHQVVADSAWKSSSGKYPFYSLYQAMDAILYTPFHEGFGNQAVEAAWAKKLLVMFGYPVAQTDIFPFVQGMIHLGDMSHLSRRQDGIFQLPPEIYRTASREFIEAVTDSTKECARTEACYQGFRRLCDISQITSGYQHFYDEGRASLPFAS